MQGLGGHGPTVYLVMPAIPTWLPAAHLPLPLTSSVRSPVHGRLVHVVQQSLALSALRTRPAVVESGGEPLNWRAGSRQALPESSSSRC